jgi:hypothetical protein
MSEQHAPVFDPDYEMYLEHQRAAAKRITFTEPEAVEIANYIRKLTPPDTMSMPASGDESDSHKSVQHGDTSLKAIFEDILSIFSGKKGKEAASAKAAEKKTDEMPLELVCKFLDFLAGAENSPALRAQALQLWGEAGLFYREGTEQGKGWGWMVRSSYEYYNPLRLQREFDERVKAWDKKSLKQKLDPGTRPASSPKWLLEEVSAYKAGRREWLSDSFVTVKGLLAGELAHRFARDAEGVKAAALQCSTDYSKYIFRWGMEGHPETWKPAADFAAGAGAMHLAIPRGVQHRPQLRLAH